MKFPILFLIPFVTSSIEPNAFIEPIDPVISTFEEDCLNYGIEIGEGWDLYQMNTNPLTFKKYVDQYNIHTLPQYRTEIAHAVLRYEDTNVYSYICRILICPISKGPINFGFHSYGENWYFRSVNLSLTFDIDEENIEIGQWAPQNIPNSVQTTLGFSIGFDGASIGFSFTYTQGLQVISRTNPATDHFESEFYYPFFDNYSNNAIVYLTSFTFTSNNAAISSIFPLITVKTKYVYTLGQNEREFNVYPYVNELLPVPST